MKSNGFIAAGAVLAIAGAASAAPLNLNLEASPDVTSAQIDVIYTSNTLSLVASGFSIAYEDDGLVATPAHPISGGLLTINATIDALGNATGGTLNITGSIPSLAIPAGTLLSGNLVDFGFDASALSTFEFVWDNLSGSLSPAYLAKAPQAGTILSNILNFPGNFAGNFNNLIQDIPGTGSAISDTAAFVPSPAGGALLVAGMAFASRRRR